MGTLKMIRLKILRVNLRVNLRVGLTQVSDSQHLNEWLEIFFKKK